MIERIAREVISSKDDYETAKERYQQKRDELRNAMINSGQERFELEDYIFIKNNDSSYMAINKETFFEALEMSGLDDGIKREIIGSALVERERIGGLTIFKRP